jgi:hypothetical protein
MREIDDLCVETSNVDYVWKSAFLGQSFVQVFHAWLENLSTSLSARHIERVTLTCRL